MSMIIHTAVMDLECFIEVEFEEEGGIGFLDIELAAGDERIPIDRSQMSERFMREAWRLARAAADKERADQEYNAAGEKYEERRTA